MPSLQWDPAASRTRDRPGFLEGDMVTWSHVAAVAQAMSQIQQLGTVLREHGCRASFGVFPNWL